MNTIKLLSLSLSLAALVLFLSSCGKSSDLSPIAPNSEENLVKVEGVIRLPKGDGTYKEVDASSFLRSSDTPYGTWSGLGVYPANTKVTVSFKPEGNCLVTSLYESSKPETRRLFFSGPISFTVVKDTKYVVTLSTLEHSAFLRPTIDSFSPVGAKGKVAFRIRGYAFAGIYSADLRGVPDGILDVTPGHGVSQELLLDGSKDIIDAFEINNGDYDIITAPFSVGEKVTIEGVLRSVFDDQRIMPLELPFDIVFEAFAPVLPEVDPTWEDCLVDPIP